MANSSIMLDLNDPRSNKIADAISNKTAKRILALLSEKEMSGSAIAKKLKIPLNTVTYNMKKLVDSGLVDKSKKFFWSSKGKRMEIYKSILQNEKDYLQPSPIILSH